MRSRTEREQDKLRTKLHGENRAALIAALGMAPEGPEPDTYPAHCGEFASWLRERGRTVTLTEALGPIDPILVWTIA